MTTKVLVTFYSTYGHVHKMAEAVREGTEEVEDTEVKLRRIPELPAAEETLSGQEDYEEAQELQSDIERVTLEDLRWADGICWGTPTRY